MLVHNAGVGRKKNAEFLVEYFYCAMLDIIETDIERQAKKAKTCWRCDVMTLARLFLRL